MSILTRQPKGRPTGGQFAAHESRASDLDSLSDSDPMAAAQAMDDLEREADAAFAELDQARQRANQAASKLFVAKVAQINPNIAAVHIDDVHDEGHAWIRLLDADSNELNPDEYDFLDDERQVEREFNRSGDYQWALSLVDTTIQVRP